MLMMMITHATNEHTLGFIRQFSADVEVTAHLVDREVNYPPWLTRMHIDYDHEQGLAKAIISQGHQAGKLFIRRYDQVSPFL